MNGSGHGPAIMQNLDIASVLFLLLGTVAGVAVIYYSLGIAGEWLGQWNRASNGTTRRAVVPDSSLDAHIATQWTEGRLRLDFLLALIKQLRPRWSRKWKRCAGSIMLIPCMNAKPVRWSTPVCGASPSINICGMSAAC